MTISDLSCGIMPLAECKAMPLGSSTEGPLSQDAEVASQSYPPLIGGWQSSYTIRLNMGRGFSGDQSSIRKGLPPLRWAYTGQWG